MDDGTLKPVNLVVSTVAVVGAQSERPGREWSYTLTVERPAYVGPPGTTPPPFPVAAEATVEVSNDGKGWILFGTLSAPTTNDVACDPTGIFGDKAYVYHRATIVSMTGGGARAYVTAVRGL